MVTYSLHKFIKPYKIMFIRIIPLSNYNFSYIRNQKVAASQKEEPSDLTSAFCAKCFEPSHNMCDRAQLMNPSIPIPCMKSLGTFERSLNTYFGGYERLFTFFFSWNSRFLESINDTLPLYNVTRIIVCFLFSPRTLVLVGDCPARYDCEPAGRHLSKRQMISMLQTFNDAVSDWAVDCLKCYGLDSNLAKYADITKRCENIS